MSTSKRNARAAKAKAGSKGQNWSFKEASMAVMEQQRAEEATARIAQEQAANEPSKLIAKALDSLTQPLPFVGKADKPSGGDLSFVPPAARPEFSDARYEAQRAAQESKEKPEFSDARFEAQRQAASAPSKSASVPTPASASKPAPLPEFNQRLLEDARERTRANNLVLSAVKQDLSPEVTRALVEHRLKGAALEAGRSLTAGAGDNLEILARVQDSRKVSGALETAANKAKTPEEANKLLAQKLDAGNAKVAAESVARAQAQPAKPEFSDARFEAQRAAQEAATAKPEFSDARFEAQRNMQARDSAASALMAMGASKEEADQLARTLVSPGAQQPDARVQEPQAARPEFSDARFEAQRMAEARESLTEALASSTSLTRSEAEQVSKALTSGETQRGSEGASALSKALESTGMARADAERVSQSFEVSARDSSQSVASAREGTGQGIAEKISAFVSAQTGQARSENHQADKGQSFAEQAQGVVEKMKSFLANEREDASSSTEQSSKSLQAAVSQQEVREAGSRENQQSAGALRAGNGEAVTDSQGQAVQLGESTAVSAKHSLEQALEQHMTHHGFDRDSVSMASDLAQAVRAEPANADSALVLHKEGENLASLRSTSESMSAQQGDSALSVQTLKHVDSHGLDGNVVAGLRDFAPDQMQGKSDVEVAQSVSTSFLDRASSEGFPKDLADTLAKDVAKDFESEGLRIDEPSSKTVALENANETWGQGMSEEESRDASHGRNKSLAQELSQSFATEQSRESSAQDEQDAEHHAQQEAELGME